MPLSASQLACSSCSEKKATTYYRFTLLLKFYASYTYIHTYACALLFIPVYIVLVCYWRSAKPPFSLAKKKKKKKNFNVTVFCAAHAIITVLLAVFHYIDFICPHLPPPTAQNDIHMYIICIINALVLVWCARMRGNCILSCQLFDGYKCGVKVVWCGALLTTCFSHLLGVLCMYTCRQWFGALSIFCNISLAWKSRVNARNMHFYNY